MSKQSIEVLWTTQVDGYWISLLRTSGEGYVLAGREEPFVDGQTLNLDDGDIDCVWLGNGASDELSIVLISAMISDGEEIFNSHIEELMRHVTA
jgi:hypothetical protein